MLEGGLDRFKVFEDVRVVEFEIIDDRNLGEVMNELASFVEERGIILITFDDKPFALGEPRSLTEIVRDTANQKARIEAIVLKHPGEQGGSGGLAVRAGHDERTFASNKKMF